MVGCGRQLVVLKPPAEDTTIVARAPERCLRVAAPLVGPLTVLPRVTRMVVGVVPGLVVWPL